MLRSLCALRHGILVANRGLCSEVKFVPEKKAPRDEKDQTMRARLFYQSKKRGILENDLLLGGFASSFLDELSRPQMQQFDDFINGGHNEWDIYYWLSDTKPVPKEIDNEIFRMLYKYSWQRGQVWHISPQEMNNAPQPK